MGWFLNRIKNSNFFGPYAGRDLINHNILPRPTQMDLLVDVYKDEVKNGAEVSTLIDELVHYNSQKYEIRNLETKLTEVNLNELIDEAEELKQLISMLIMKNQNYKSAQKMIALLLDEVASVFNSKIKPHVTCGVTKAIAEQLIAQHLEGEIRKALGENVLEIYNRQIKGMLYFLTGNCHLEWK
ncbi:hypothetical protein DM807_08455 [Pseudomonas hunanensis]|nr:hypothetical protein [Pseudomonas hunanensis]